MEILRHRDGIPPTKSEIKQAIIQRLLDIEYCPGTNFQKEEPEAWERERQMLVLRCEWNKISCEELLKSLAD